MKKLLSFILTLSILFSLATPCTALYQEPLEETPLETISEEGLELSYEEPAPAETAEEVIPHSLLVQPVDPDLVSDDETAQEVDDDTLARLDRAEIRAAANLETMSDWTAIEVTPVDGVTTQAATYNVTVKITFPYAATAAGQVQLRLYSPAETDENGFVTRTPHYYYTWVNVAEGAAYVSNTFSVPAGNYFPGVYTNDPYFGLYMRTANIFNADGSVATNSYTATAVKVSGSKTFNVTAPQPARVINGTVEFSEPLTEDLYFEIDGCSYSRWNSKYFYVSYEAAEGATSVPFSIPVSEGSYYLELCNNNGWAYYDIYGGMTTDYSNRAFLSVLEDSVTGLVLDGDFLLPEQEEEDDEESNVVTYWYAVDYTVTLPEATTEEKAYMPLVFSNGALIDYDTIYVEAGSTEFTWTFYMKENRSFSVAYIDATGLSNVNSYSFPAARYLGKNGTVTSNLSEADVFTMGTESLSITMDDTDNYKLSGTITLGAALRYDKSYYAMMDVGSDQQFGARVYFAAGETTQTYTIYVPKDNENSDFTHWIALATSGEDTYLDEDSRINVGTGTITGNANLTDYAFPTTPINVTGTISLPEGMTAPAGGLALYLYVNGNFAGNYYMAEDTSSVTLNFATELYENNEDNYISITLRNPSDDLYDGFVYYGESGGTMTDLDLTLLEAVTLSGHIVVPDSAKDKMTTVYIQSYSYPEDVAVSSDYRYISVSAGETSEFYSVKAVKDAALRVQAYVSADGTGTVVSGEYLYLQKDGTTSTNYCNTAVLTADHTANFTFEEGNLISGTISLAEGIPGGAYSYQISVRPSSGGSRRYTYGSFNGTSGTWQIAVPKSTTSSWYVVCTLSYEDSGSVNVLTDVELYYTADGGSMDYSDRETVTAPASDINFIFPAAYTISGTVSIPESLQSESFSGAVMAVSTDYNYYYGSFSSSNPTYEIKVPTDSTIQYRLATYIYDSDTPIPGLYSSDLYLTETGEMSCNYSDAALFTVTEAGLIANVGVLSGESCFVTIKAPDGYSSYYQGELSLFDKETGEHLTSSYFSFSGVSTVKTLTVLEAHTDKDLILGVYLWSGEGVVTGYERYWCEDGWTNTSRDADSFPFDDGSVTITLPGAKTAAVTINAPDGFPGYYEGWFYLMEQNGSNSYQTVSWDYFEFDGASTTFDILLPNEDSDTYLVYICLNSAVASPTSTDYYYAGDNTWSKNFGDLEQVDFSSGAFSCTLPKAKFITGKLLSSDGTDLIIPQENAFSFNLYSSNGNYIDCNARVDIEGNFTICVDENLSGSYYLYCWPTASGTNVVSYDYYYYSGATTSKTYYDYEDENYLFTLGDESVSDLTIYVDTGYLLTGTVELDENASISNSRYNRYGWAYVDICSDNYNGRTSVSMTVGAREWTYSIAVPKTTATYTVSTMLSLYDNTVSNLYTGYTKQFAVEVTGDQQLSTITLCPAKSFVDVTVTNPLSGTYARGYVCVVTPSGGEYSSYFYIYNDQTSASVSIGIPASETSETYQVYYYLERPSDLLRYQAVYLTKEGTLTTDASLAGTFSFEDDTTHAITLLELPSYTLTIQSAEGFPGYYRGYAYLCNESGSYIQQQYFKFDGESTTVTFTPASGSGTYKVYVQLYDGIGLTTYTNYYYSEAGWTTDFDSGDWIDFTTGDASVTFPEPKTISGKLISTDGDAVLPPNHSVSFILYDENDRSTYYTGYIYEDGTYAIALDPNLTGTYAYGLSIYESSGTNILPNWYYYCSDAEQPVYTYENASYITVGDDNITGLDLYVDTGYVITGTVKLAEDATYECEYDNLGWACVSLSNDSYTYSYEFELLKGETSWDYTLVVPKTESTYNIHTQLYLNEEATSNLYPGSYDHGVLTVTDSAPEGPTLTLPVATTFVDVTVTTPLSGYYTGGHVFVETDSNWYSTDFYISDQATQAAVSIPISPAETGETYRVGYYLWQPSDLLCYTNVYVSENGELTTSYDNAATFQFTDNTKHSITLMESLSLSLTIKAPEGYSNHYYSGYVYLCVDGEYGWSSAASQYFEMNGTESTTLTIKPSIVSNEYKVCVYLYSGVGTPTYTYCFYGEEGWTTNYDEADWLDATSGEIEIPLASPKVISGKLVSAQGDDISIVNNALNFYLYTADGYRYYDFSYTLDREGNFSLLFNDDVTGTFALRLTNYASSGSNILYNGAYYYKADATEAHYSYDFSDESYFITLGEDSITGVELYVDTGYVISGAIGLAEDATITSSSYTSGYVTVSMDCSNENNETYNANTTVYLYADTDWTYSLTVPKTMTSATVSSYVYLYSSTESNLYTGNYYKQATLDLTTDALDNVDLTLLTGGPNINITITNPLSDYSARGYVYVVTDVATYSSYIYLYSDSSTTFTITVPPSDASETYRIYYDLSSPSALNCNVVYVAQDGTLTTNEAEAGQFRFDTTTEHTFTLLERRTYELTIQAPEICSDVNYYGTAYLYAGDDSNYYYVGYSSFDFYNGSTTLTFTPSEELDNYKVCIYLRGGIGMNRYTDYYYSAEGWTTSFSEGDWVDFSTNAATVQLPTPQTIQGKLVSADGDTISVPEGAYFTVYTESGSYVNNRSILDEDGNFTILLNSTVTESVRLYFTSYNTSSGNILGNSYYYKSDATEPQYSYNYGDETYFVNVGEADVTDLVIYVDTGYIISGAILLPEGAYLTSDNDYLGYLYITLNAYEEDSMYADYSANCYVELYSSDDSWTYSVLAPKGYDRYTILTTTCTSSYAQTNLFTDESYTQHVYDSLDSNMTLDLTLPLPKEIISITLNNPLPDQNTYGWIYVETEYNDYTSYGSYFDFTGESTTVAITVSPEDTSETYKLFYYLYSPYDLVRYQNVYVAEDGTLTTDYDQAGVFNFSDKKEFAITLAERTPVIAGRIYLPDNLDDDYFEVALYDSCCYTTYISVDSTTIQTDADGRQYVTYKKFSDYDCSGSTFYMYYWLYDYSGDALYQGGDDIYLTENGALCFSYPGYNLSTPADGSTLEMDFTLADWDYGSDKALLQSEHGFTTTAERTFTLSFPGASSVSVTFDPRTDIDLMVNGEEQSYYYEDMYFELVDGVLTITVPAGTYDDKVFGFAITSITPNYSEGTAETGVVAVYTTNGSDQSIVMTDLIAGKTVRLTLMGQANSTGTLAAAVYNANGRMIDVILEGLTFDENGYAVCPLNYDNSAENGVTLQLMLVTVDTWIPLMQSVSLSNAN